MNKFFIIFFFSVLLFPLAGQAGFLDSLACINSGHCGLNDIATALVELIRLLLGLIGGVSLVYFVWGGIRWMTSGGNPEKVAKGRNIMINTVFALLLAFSSYIILDFFVNDILGAKSKFVVKSECPDGSDGNVCNSGEDNYQCFQGSCLTKCAIADFKVNEGIAIDGWEIQESWTLSCADIENLELSSSIVWHDLSNYCPGGENVKCIARKADGSLVLNSDMIP